MATTMPPPPPRILAQRLEAGRSRGVLRLCVPLLCCSSGFCCGWGFPCSGTSMRDWGLPQASQQLLTTDPGLMFAASPLSVMLGGRKRLARENPPRVFANLALGPAASNNGAARQWTWLQQDL